MAPGARRGYCRSCQGRQVGRPVYTFDLGSDRYVTAALEGATRDYETVVVAWDENMLRAAAEEAEEIRREARKNAADRRRSQVNDAAEAF